ncbi:MAG: putative oxidoreductase [Polyangiales bacterium]|jgi:putative oxidoreductase
MSNKKQTLTDLGLLALRIAAGGLMIVHGIGKLDATPSEFPDPLGVGAALSHALAVFAEVGCAAALVVGAFTRFALVPLIVTMLVAALVVHGADPWNKKELAVIYLSLYAGLMLTGPGRFSVDAWLSRRRI